MSQIFHRWTKIGKDEDLREIQDSMVMSMVRQELDFASNTQKEDQIITTGLTSQIPMPHKLKIKGTG
jgi:hypothetical protein